MVRTYENRVIFARKLLVTCVRGRINWEGNMEERAFRTGLNLPCLNGFRFSKVNFQLFFIVKAADSTILQLCSEYDGGWEGFLMSLNASSIQSFEDLQPVLTVNQPWRALRHLHSIEGFQESSFNSLIIGFLQRTGWPLGDPNEDPLGLRELSSWIGYLDLSSHLAHPGFRSQLLYRCATASDSLLGGQNIIVSSTFMIYPLRC
jgi:hypothetical protein